MANESIQLRAKAKSLGIEGYKAMSQDDLRTAIKKAEKPGSGKTAGSKNGATSGRKSAATSKVTKTAGKKSAGKKSSAGTSRKTAPKSAPAKSAKSGTAKRPAAQGRKVTKAAPAGVGRVAIDNTSIDWTAESRIGQSGGNRQVIMKALRSKKGNVEKVYALLADKAQSMYAKTEDGRKRTKADAQTLLRWHISRVKFDFVKDTGQHNGATRSGGTSKATTGRKNAPAKSAGKKAPAKKSSAKKPAKKSGKKSAASRKRGK
jgi:hypothetical protein